MDALRRAPVIVMQSITTIASTIFTANGQTSSLTSVTVGKFIEVVGQKQSDGAWLATQVRISDNPQRWDHSRGKVCRRRDNDRDKDGR